MYEIRLTGGKKIKVNTAKSIDEMLEWLNGICDEGFEFVGLYSARWENSHDKSQ